MTVIDFHQVRRGWGAGRPVWSLAFLFASLISCVCVTAAWLFGNFLVPVLVFTAIGALAARGLLLSYDHKFFGACNTVTLLRGAMVSVLAGAVVGPANDGWAVFLIAGTALALDGVDGWLARRSGLTSEFGARFDMEIDAAFGAILALIVLRNGHVGPEILVLGFTRYIFVAAGVVLPFIRARLSESLRRKVICVVQIASLIALISPILPNSIAALVAWGASILLIWSFAVDTVWLHRNRK